MRSYVLARWRYYAGAFWVLLAGIVLYTRFSINGALSRDEAVYVYAAQRFSHGVAPYVSIFDPKGPGATMLGGTAAFSAHIIGLNDLHTIRFAFFLISLATVVAVYVLAYELWHSVPGAVAAGVAFTCFGVFAHDALVGPDAKTPGVLVSVICMTFLIRRQWFVSGVFAGLAFVVWQPFMWLAVVAIVASAVHALPGRRWHAAGVAFAGAAVPTAILVVYFLAVGALSDFLSAALVFPFTGKGIGGESIARHFTKVPVVIDRFGLSATVVWVGTAALVGLVVAQVRKHRGNWQIVLGTPLVLVVFSTFVLNILYAFVDFQWDPDTLPLLPYPALGIGGVVALLMTRVPPHLKQRAIAAVLAATVVLAAVGFWQYDRQADNNTALVAQLRGACAVKRLLGSGRLVSLGDPLPYVLLHRTSSTRYIYLASGVDEWRIEHSPGGLQRWQRNVTRGHPNLILLNGWTSPSAPSPLAFEMADYLKTHGYIRRWLGRQRIFITREGRRVAREVDVRPTIHSTLEPLTWDGSPIPPNGRCVVPSAP